MPICPRCSATIHTGANDLCPACGYCLPLADKSFGEGQVEFSRVVDSAGALTHQERQELLHYLEDLERSIPPVALCIYITDDGHADEFRTHAHWILNHAHIHHPSFGRREKHKAIEDAELSLRIAREAAEEELPSHAPAQGSWLSRIRSYVRDALHPNLPPPVQQRWMLILVLDVQLERACFSWGYQLDPYINPDSINSCIVAAKFQFRERAMVAGLKLVMRDAARQIAACSRRVNARLRRTGRLKSLSAWLPLLASGLLLAGAPCEAVPAAAKAAAASPTPAAANAVPALADDDVAEEVVDAGAPAAGAPVAGDAASAVPAACAEGAAAPVAGGVSSSGSAAAPASAPLPEPGSPATFAAPPRWEDGDYRHLMAGELVDAYTLLAPPAEAPRVERRFRSVPAEREDARRVPARYSGAYNRPSPAGLSDPQGLLTVEERRDVEHVLRECNADGHFRIYVALYQQGQQLPPELAVHTLTTAMAKPCEYAVLLLFPLGSSLALDLGYQQVNPADADRHAWLQRVRSAAEPEGNGVEALLLAIREVHAIMAPLAVNFHPISAEVAGTPPLIPVELRPETEEKKVPLKDKIEAFATDEGNLPLIITVVALLALAGLATLVFFLRRRTGSLLESREDVRLSSPYGAGVSRYVRYLEGKESPKESRIY